MTTTEFKGEWGSAEIVHNSNWSGMSKVRFILPGEEYSTTFSMPGEVLLAVGKKAAFMHLVSQVATFLEWVDAPK